MFTRQDEKIHWFFLEVSVQKKFKFRNFHSYISKRLKLLQER